MTLKKIMRGIQKKLRSAHGGFTLIETILFVGLLAGMSMVIVLSSLSISDARIRQHSIADVEQRGGQLMMVITKAVRRSEVILSPSGTLTGSILALQMSANAENPTIFSQSGSNILLVQKTSTSALLGGTLVLKNLSFRKVGSTSVTVAFDLTTIMPLPRPIPFSRHFEGIATRVPVDQLSGGGCGTCALPSCSNHRYQWYYCATTVCTVSPVTIGC